MKTLSFILPLYNGEKYIERCLISIFNQGPYPIDILIIDDGSTDNSLEIINRISDKNIYSYKVKIISQPNSGVAAARNNGIKLSDSDYISFIDQDDYITSDYCRDFYKEIDSCDYDMVIGGFCRYNSSGKITRKFIPKDTPWSKYCLTYPWGRIINRFFLIKNNISFLTTSIGEDVYFDLVAYSYAKKIKMISTCSYIWFDNPVSVSNTKYTVISSLINPVETFNKAILDMNHSDKALYIYEEYYFIKFIVWYLLSNVRNSSHKDILLMRDNLFKWLKINYPDYKNNRLISPFKPYGDLALNKLCVWGYILSYRLNLDKLILYILSK